VQRDNNASRPVAGKNRFANAPVCRKPNKMHWSDSARFHRAISQIGIAASISLNPDLLRAAGVCLHVDLFASVCIYDLERGRRIIQSH